MHSSEEKANYFAKHLRKGFQPNDVTKNFILQELNEIGQETQVTIKT